MSSEANSFRAILLQGAQRIRKAKPKVVWSVVKTTRRVGVESSYERSELETRDRILYSVKIGIIKYNGELAEWSKAPVY